MAARAMGSRLIVSISADSFISKIKAGRPVFSEAERKLQLRNLRFVDDVFISYADCGDFAIRGFRPDIFVRGIDYKESGIDPREAQACKDVKCQVCFTDTPKLNSSDYINGLYEKK